MERAELVEIVRGPDRRPAPAVRLAVGSGVVLPAAAVLVWLHLEGGAALFALVGPRPPRWPASMAYRAFTSTWHLAVFCWSALLLLLLAGAWLLAWRAGWCIAARRALAAAVAGAGAPVGLVVAAVRAGARGVRLAVVVEAGGRRTPLLVTRDLPAALTVARCAVGWLDRRGIACRLETAVVRDGEAERSAVAARSGLEEAVRERVRALAAGPRRVPRGVRRVEDPALRDALLGLARRAAAVPPPGRRVAGVCWALAVIAVGTVAAGRTFALLRTAVGTLPDWLAGEIELWGGLAVIGASVAGVVAAASGPAALGAALLGRRILSLLGREGRGEAALCLASRPIGGRLRHGIALAALRDGELEEVGAWPVGSRTRTLRLAVRIAREAWRRGVALRVGAVDTGADPSRGEPDAVWLPSDPAALPELLEAGVPLERPELPDRGLI